MSDKISVVIPVYKVEPYLDQCVQSVVDQTYTDLEIILVDDGSPDNCPAMCDAWAERDSRIKVIHKQNGGLSDARNAGLEIATGSYISFVDSDDWVSPDMFELLVGILEQADAQIAECGTVSVYPETERQPCERPEGSTPAFATYGTEEAMRHLLAEDVFSPMVWNKLYRRECISNLRFEVGKLHEDVFFTHQAFGNCARIAKVETACYFYLQRHDSIMGKPFSLGNLDSLEGKLRRMQYMQDHFPNLVFLSRKGLHFFSFYCGQRALLSQDREIIKQAFAVIGEYRKKSYFPRREYRRLSGKEKTWYWLGRMWFKGCCMLRNHLKIGF